MNKINQWISTNAIFVANFIFGTSLLLWYLFIEIDKKNFVIYIVLAGVFFGITLFIRLFTLPIPENLDRPSPFLRPLFIYSYAFMFLAIGTAIVPFFISYKGTELEQRPISLILGCSVSEDASEDLKCVNDETIIANPDQEADSAEAQERADEAKMVEESSTEAATQSIEESDQNVKEGLKVMSRQWLINIGGGTKCNDSVNPVECVVYGGLVVPLYFIVLALLGGAISLTRRIPEYQKQGSENYIQTPGNPKRMSPEFVREALAFQIVQFVSAPLIAISAFYIINPVSSAGVVALGFAAGFSSETILKLIREFLNKITPDYEQYQGDRKLNAFHSTGKITGKVIDSSDQGLAEVEVSVFQADVLIISKKTTEEGVFKFTDVPVGMVVVKTSNDGQEKGKNLIVRQGFETECTIRLD